MALIGEVLMKVKKLNPLVDGVLMATEPTVVALMRYQRAYVAQMGLSMIMASTATCGQLQNTQLPTLGLDI
jgi:hypothetical protein